MSVTSHGLTVTHSVIPSWGHLGKRSFRLIQLSILCESLGTQFGPALTELVEEKEKYIKSGDSKYLEISNAN